MFHNFICGNSCIKEVNEGGEAELEYKREILSARIFLFLCYESDGVINHKNT